MDKSPLSFQSLPYKIESKKNRLQINWSPSSFPLWWQRGVWLCNFPISRIPWVPWVTHLSRFAELQDFKKSKSAAPRRDVENEWVWSWNEPMFSDVLLAQKIDSWVVCAYIQFRTYMCSFYQVLLSTVQTLQHWRPATYDSEPLRWFWSVSHDVESQWLLGGIPSPQRWQNKARDGMPPAMVRRSDVTAELLPAIALNVAHATSASLLRKSLKSTHGETYQQKDDCLAITQQVEVKDHTLTIQQENMYKGLQFLLGSQAVKPWSPCPRLQPPKRRTCHPDVWNMASATSFRTGRSWKRPQGPGCSNT